MAEFDYQASCLVICDHTILIKLNRREGLVEGHHCNEKMVCVCAKLLQLCLTPYDSMGCSLPDSSVHGILQPIILEWVAIPFSMGSSQPRDRTWVSYIAGGFFTV